MNIRSIYMFLICVLVFSCGKEQIPQSLIGEYECTSLARIEDGEKVEIKIKLIVNEDFSVIGNVGSAELKDCYLQRNRGKFGRKLNIKSDYIIIGGKIMVKLLKLTTKRPQEFHNSIQQYE
jgi:hypothetical protein